MSEHRAVITRIVGEGADAPALVALAEQYANAYDEDPAAFFGMLAAGQHILQSQMGDVHALLGKVAPVLEDPSVILSSLPPGLRAMLGV